MIRILRFLNDLQKWNLGLMQKPDWSSATLSTIGHTSLSFTKIKQKKFHIFGHLWTNVRAQPCAVWRGRLLYHIEESKKLVRREKKKGGTSYFCFVCIKNANWGKLPFGELFLVISSTTSEAKWYRQAPITMENTVGQRKIFRFTR